jgi:hypothetical protein
MAILLIIIPHLSRESEFCSQQRPKTSHVDVRSLGSLNYGVTDITLKFKSKTTVVDRRKAHFEETINATKRQ